MWCERLKSVLTIKTVVAKEALAKSLFFVLQLCFSAGGAYKFPVSFVRNGFISDLEMSHLTMGSASHAVVVRLHTRRVEMPPRRSKVRALSFGF